MVLKSILHRLRWLDTYLRPARQDVLLKELVIDAPAHHKILNLGSGQRNILEHPGLVNLDLFIHFNADVVADGHTLPFADCSFDSVYIGAVIEHVSRPWIVTKEIHRVLKPTGRVLATTPFIYPYHDIPADYYRFTEAGLEEIFRPCVKIETGIGRGGSGMLIEIMKAYCAAWFSNPLIIDIVYALTSTLLHPFKYLDYLLSLRQNSFTVAGGFYYLGERPL